MLREDWAKLKKACAEEHNFSKESLDKLHHHDEHDHDKHDHDDLPNLACFQKCFMEKVGIVDGSKLNEGKIRDIQRVYKKEDSNFDEKFKECEKVFKADPFTCENARAIFKCFH